MVAVLRPPQTEPFHQRKMLLCPLYPFARFSPAGKVRQLIGMALSVQFIDAIHQPDFVQHVRFGIGSKKATVIGYTPPGY